MTMDKWIVAAIVLALFAGGCDGESDKQPAEPDDQQTSEKKADDEQNAASDSAGSEEEPDSRRQSEFADAVEEEAPFERERLIEVAKAWQGAWIIPTSGRKLAWNVTGTHITQYDGERYKSMKLTVLAPCYIEAKEKTDRGAQATFHKFVHTENQTYVGRGAGGILTEDGAVVCDGRKIYALSGTECTAWENGLFDRWESHPAKCSIDNDTFKLGDKNLEKVDGAFVDRQMKRSVAERFDDYDEAKKVVKKANE